LIEIIGSMTVVQIIVARTQQDQLGLSVAAWFAERAREHAGFEIQLVDLAEAALDNSTVDANAFVFVVPDDDDAIDAALTNVTASRGIDWEYKALGFISYGSTSRGLGAVETLKEVLTTLKMMPIDTSVAIDDEGQSIEAGRFIATEAMENSAKAMLDGLWSLNPFLDALRGWAATTDISR
jgi:NAD(P)H-dependent FMN reductase